MNMINSLWAGIARHHRPYTMFLGIYAVTVSLWYWETGSISKAMSVALLGSFLKALVVEIHHKLWPHEPYPCKRCIMDDMVEDIVTESARS
jgi:uncharacterized membrane protein